MRLFVDQDQTLADFDAAFKKMTHFEPYEYKRVAIEHYQQQGMPKKEAERMFVIAFWIVIHEHKTWFWENIPPMKDFKTLWKFIKPYDPIVLTAVPEFIEVKELAIEGKRKWINKWMSAKTQLITIDLNSFNHRKMDKTVYCNGPEDVLIDDNEFNVKAWRKKGGFAIYHTDAESTINELKSFMKGLKR